MMLKVLLAGALAASAVQGVPSDKAPPVLANAVPKDAFFLVQARGLDGLRSDFEAGAWYGFYRDEETKGLRGWIEQKIAEEKGKEEAGGLDVDPWDLVRSVHGSVAFFGVAIAGRKEPALGVLVDPGEPRGAFEDILAKVLEEGRKTRIPSSDEYAGVELQLFEQKPEEEQPESPGSEEGESEDSEETADETQSAEDDGVDHSAVFECSGVACFVVADSRENVLHTAHGIIDRLSGKDASKGIEGNDLLAEARRSVTSPGRFEAYVDLSRVVEMIQGIDPPDEESQRVLRALGVDDLRWVYASGDVGKGERASFDLAMKFPEKGYLRDWLGLLGTISRETARMAPRESLAVTLAQFDVWGLWESAWKLAAEIDKDAAEEGRAQVDAALAQFGAEDLETSFLSQLDGRFMTFGIKVPEDEWKAVLEGAAGDPGSATTTSLGNAMVIGFEDAQGVSRFVQAVLERVGVSAMVKTEEFQGNTIHKLAMGPGPGMQWAFTKKACILSQFPTAVRAALRMEGAEQKDSVLEKESFKPFFESHANAGMLGLMSTPEMLKGFLTGIDTMRGVLGEMGGDPFPPFPSPAAVDRHFKGTLVSTVARTGGVLRFQLSSK